MNKQKERQQRGKEFENELRASWGLLKGVWRFRIPDGGGGTRPGDELILLDDVNILGEHKRTASDRFQLSYLRTDQVQGLLAFDMVIKRNLGLVFVSFLNDNVDHAYCFRLITALQFMHETGRKYITLAEFQNQELPCVELPRLPGEARVYDMKGVQICYKSL